MTADNPNGVQARFWNPVVAFLYVSLWGIPHHLAPDGGWPWLGLIRSIVDFSIFQVGTLMGRW